MAKLKSEQSSLVIDRQEIEARLERTNEILALGRVEMPDLLHELQLWEIKMLTAERMKIDLSLVRKRYERAVMLFHQGRREWDAVKRMGPRVRIIEAIKEKSSTAD